MSQIPVFQTIAQEVDDTPHIATRYARRLVRGYSFSLLAELRPMLRTLLYGASVFQPPRLAATPPIFYVRKTHGEKMLPVACAVIKT